MLLGILIHTSNVYTPQSTWIVSDPPGAPVFGLLSDALHVFRMPAFFWISGFFCAMTFSRSGPAALLRTRLPRIAVPLLVTYLTLNVAQEALVSAMSGAKPEAAWTTLPDLYHLWFLADLLVFIAIAAILLPAMSRWTSRPCRGVGRWKLIAALTMASYSIELAARSTGHAYDSILGITSLYRLAEYIPYFIAGNIMFLRTDLFQASLSVPKSLFPFAVAGAVALESASHGPVTPLTEIARIVQVGCTWVSALALLTAFTDWFRTGTAFTRLVSDSAYTVYLFHHIIVVGFALALASWPAGPAIKFSIVCIGAACVAFAIHQLIIRNVPVLRYLFNGK